MFAVGYPLLASLQWSYPLPPTQRTLLQLALFVVIGTYFVFCWTRTGQTLALKAWRLKVVDSVAGPPAAFVQSRVTYWHGICGCRGWQSPRLPAKRRLDVAGLAVCFALLLIPALTDAGGVCCMTSGPARVVRVPAYLSPTEIQRVKSLRCRDTATQR